MKGLVTLTFSSKLGQGSFGEVYQVCLQAVHAVHSNLNLGRPRLRMVHRKSNSGLSTCLSRLSRLRVVAAAMDEEEAAGAPEASGGRDDGPRRHDAPRRHARASIISQGKKLAASLGVPTAGRAASGRRKTHGKPRLALTTIESVSELSSSSITDAASDLRI